MIKTVIFDMGQVLIHWSGKQLLQRFSLNEADEQLLLTELFASIEWTQLDRGCITEAEGVERVCARLPEHLHAIAGEMITGWWKQPLWHMEGMDALVRELKQAGYGIYVLSNAGLPLRQYWPRLPGADCFDGVLVSAEEKLLKPQPEIFRTFLSRFGLEAENCVFIDDSVANAECAVLCGIRGIVFRGDTGRLRRELRAMGVACEA